MTTRARARRTGPTPIRFVLGDQIRTLDGVDPTTTVLEYLRGTAGRFGTKEGCAEGDCGACTVLLGVLDGSQVSYRTVNACLLFVPALHGRQLLTVEDLRGAGGRLHPVQQAMVDHHGSQCGFCTPGIVMSLAALGYEARPSTREKLDTALAGNLCRCTGYVPIVAAARAVDGLAAPSAGSDGEGAIAARERTVKLLRAIRSRETFAVAYDDARYYVPTSIDELARLVRRYPEATLLAGGTDLGPVVTKEQRGLGTVIETTRVRELTRIRATTRRVELGAAVTWTAAESTLAELHPDLGELVRRFGSVQIRNVATIGGNIATGSPVGDALPALLALGASVVLRRGSATRELALEDFVVGYRCTALARAEFIARIRIPRPSAWQRFAFYKVAKRFDQDIASVSAGLCITIEDSSGERRVVAARFCYGGMAETVRRAAGAERAVIGETWSESSVAAAAAALSDDFAPIDDLRASARYRALVARNLLRRFFVETTDPATATRVHDRRDGANAPTAERPRGPAGTDVEGTAK